MKDETVYDPEDSEKAVEAYETTGYNSLSVTPLSETVLLIVNGNGGCGMLNLEKDEVDVLVRALQFSSAQITHGVGNA